MIRFDVSIEIERPPSEVFGFISDFEKNPLWQSGMVEARFTSPPPLGVGSTYVQVARFLGRRIDSEFRVESFEPGRSVTIQSIGGTFPIRVTRQVEPSRQGSRVSAVIEGEATGVFKLAEPVLRGVVKRTVDGDYARLKELLESENAPT